LKIIRLIVYRLIIYLNFIWQQ